MPCDNWMCGCQIHYYVGTKYLGRGECDMLTKKHFQQLADIVAGLHADWEHIPQAEAILEDLERRLIDLCMRQNSAFNIEKFSAACRLR